MSVNAFPAADPCKVSDVNTRYQLFLQVRSDVLTCANTVPVPVDTAIELAALALQSEVPFVPICIDL